MIYVVLGMHKSGTTLISRLLHHSGVNMGESIDPNTSYDRGNKYERRSTLELNVSILGLKDFRDPSLSVPAPDPPVLTQVQRTRMDEIIRECNRAHTDWGFKDPRTCLVYPLWASALPEHRIIAIFRPANEIWPRYRHQRLNHFHRNPSRAWAFLKGWCTYNASILTHLENTSMNSLVLSYRELMTSDTGFQRLQRFVGVELSDQRQTNLYRTRSEGSPLLWAGARLAHKQSGCSPQLILEQFQGLRNDTP